MVKAYATIQEMDWKAEAEMYRGLYSKLQGLIGKCMDVNNRSKDRSPVEGEQWEIIEQLVKIICKPNGVPDYKELLEVLKHDVQLLQHMHSLIPDSNKQPLHTDDKVEQMEANLEKSINHLKYYENSNTPPSQDSIPAKMERERKRKDPSEFKTPGRKEGHDGISHNRKSTESVECKAAKCTNCGGTNLEKHECVETKQVMDIPPPPKLRTTTYTSWSVKCTDCGSIEPGKSLEDHKVAIKGTSMGPDISAVIADQWDKGMTSSAIRDTINNEYGGKNISKATIINCLNASGHKLNKTRNELILESKKAERGHMDETSYKIMEKSGSKRGYVWTVITLGGRQKGDTVLIYAEKSRSKKTLEKINPPRNIPMTCDGYIVYKIFKILQRCWIHVLRDAKEIARIYGDESVELSILYGRIAVLFDDLKIDRRPSLDAPMIDTGPIIAELKLYAEEYKNHTQGKSFAVTLANAAEDLVTFVNRPGVDPSNNLAERCLRQVVRARKNRYRIVSEVGARTFENILSCTMTWRMRGLNVYEEMRAALRGE